MFNPLHDSPVFVLPCTEPQRSFCEIRVVMGVSDPPEDPRTKTSMQWEGFDVYIKRILPARSNFVSRGAAGLEKGP